MLLAHITLYGHFQSLDFRTFAYNTATELGLSGNVENNDDNDDGAVLINVYSKNKNVLDTFIKKMKKGPPYSSISKCHVVITTSDPPLEEGFDIET